MDAFLAEYIKSYDDFVSNFNNIAYLIFGACVFLVSRKFGIVRDYSNEWFSHVSLLIFAMIGCIVTFSVNFLIQGGIAHFFSESYMREVPTHTEFRTCHYGDRNCPRESPVECFQRIRKEILTPLTIISMVSLGLSLIAFGTWFLTNVLRRNPHEDKKQ